MSKITANQKTIYDLLSNKKSDFLIPDYQRPYAWGEDQCQTLWDDLFAFTIPDGNYKSFDKDDSYFLGSIVAFNDNNKFEIIDGQQRLTTLMLLLRAFYDKFEFLKDEDSQSIRKLIEVCIWKTDEFGRPDKTQLRIDSEVATDDSKEEFLEILKTGEVPSSYRSRYAKNFRFFLDKIAEASQKYVFAIYYLPARILSNSVILFVEADNQEGALRIFSTLNDRGLPLADADIFKSQFYKETGKDASLRQQFIAKWKCLEETTNKLFKPPQGTAMDELFSKYMYFLRAKEGNQSTSVMSLREFYRRDNFKYLKTENALQDLIDLANFWQKIKNQDSEFFPDSVLRKLFILNESPNSMWENLLSVYFFANRNNDNNINMIDFERFLDKTAIFVIAYSLYNPGVNQLRTPAFKEMVKVVNGEKSYFNGDFKFDKASLRKTFENYEFTNKRAITKSVLTWHAFQDDSQPLLPISEDLQIEHIFAKKRAEIEGINDDKLIESLGNKILLEKSINIKASDYRFEDKKAFYSGEKRRSKFKDPSKIAEIHSIIKQDDFNEDDIRQRNTQILDQIFSKLSQENLLK